MQRGTAQLLWILVVILVVLSGIYFYQVVKKGNSLQTPVFTSVKELEFNDYSNKDLGLSFKTAKSLSIKTDSEEEFNKRGNGNFRKNFKGYVGYEPAQPLGAVAVLDKTGAYDANPFSVWVFDNPKELTTEQWFKDYWYYPYLWGVFDWASKSHIALDTEATISGLPAKSKIVAYQTDKPKYLYIAKDKKMYLFRIINNADNTGDKILSNFKFLKDQKNSNKDECKVTGCSRQICSDKDVVTTCEFLPQYACYKAATCERQTNGRCGWTKTAELNKCLKQF